MNPTRRHCLTALVLLSTTAATAPSTLAAEPTLASLRENEVASALRQALEIAAGHTVRRLGQADGFLGNEKVRIPLPGGLAKVEGALRAVGLGTQAQELVNTMNRAAASGRQPFRTSSRNIVTAATSTRHRAARVTPLRGRTKANGKRTIEHSVNHSRSGLGPARAIIRVSRPNFVDGVTPERVKR